MAAAPPAAGPSQSVRSAGVLLWVNNEQILVGLKRDPKKGLENFGGKIKKRRKLARVRGKGAQGGERPRLRTAGYRLEPSCVRPKVLPRLLQRPRGR